jgi:hypothetical protein
MGTFSMPWPVQRQIRQERGTLPLDLNMLPLLDVAALLEADDDRARAVETGANVLREKPGTGWPATDHPSVCSPTFAVGYWLLLRRVRGRDLRNRTEGRP